MKSKPLRRIIASAFILVFSFLIMANIYIPCFAAAYDNYSYWIDFDRYEFNAIPECSLKNCKYFYTTDTVNNEIYILFESYDDYADKADSFTEKLNVIITTVNDVIYDKYELDFSDNSEDYAGNSCRLTASWDKGSVGPMKVYVKLYDFSRSVLEQSFKIKLTASGGNGIISGTTEDNVILMNELVPLAGEEITEAVTEGESGKNNTSSKSGKSYKGSNKTTSKKASSTSKEYPPHSVKNIITAKSPDDTITLSKGKIAAIVCGSLLLGSTAAVVIILAQKHRSKKRDNPKDELSEKNK